MEAAPQLEAAPPSPPAAAPAGKAKKILIAAGSAVALVVLLGLLYWAYTHPTVKIVNASAVKELTIFVDDEQVATGLAPTLREEDASAGAASTLVATGEHTFSARDATGKVIDEQKLTISAGETYLYAPAHSRKVCWTFQTDGYGDVEVEQPLVALDPTKSFWELPRSPDHWFQDTPDTVKTKKDSKGTKKTALRQHVCGDPQFEP